VGLWLALSGRCQPGGLGSAFAVLGLGWLLNVVPMALDGGMPVSSAALRAIGAGDEAGDVALLLGSGAAVAAALRGAM
jgi:hypothetical protein